MKHTSEEIKYRLSDLGVQIGNIAIEYITELEKENARLKEINTHTLSQLNLDNGELIIENEKLKKENAELKEQNRNLLESCEGATMMYKDLCKAKELLKYVLNSFVGDLPKELGFFDEEELKAIAEVEQFLKEIKE